MQNPFLYLLFAVVAACLVFVADAMVGLVRRSRGIDDEAVGRRLSAAALSRTRDGAGYEILLPRGDGAKAWQDFVPFAAYVRRLVLQSATRMTMEQLFWTVLGIGAAAGLVAALLLPLSLLALAVPTGLACGIAPVLMVLSAKRAKRVALFGEQLPDAIDLIVRSLRVGHPLSAAIGVIGREMPEPVASEFAIAADQASYGKPIARALAEMQQRVPVPDLGYLVVVVQIQEESGGNLVESLGKLAGVIRERFRMFRKAHAITAEGRISAWLLSLFPFVIAGLVMLAKPDYYSQVADYPMFHTLVVITVILLAVNIAAMRVLTRLDV